MLTFLTILPKIAERYKFQSGEYFYKNKTYLQIVNF